MSEGLPYAQLLRPIGQLLESLRIESFAIIEDAGEFLVRDRTRNRAQLTPREKAFLAELQLSHNREEDKAEAMKLASGLLEWRLTIADLERIEREGQSRRTNPELTPDIHALSQTLRVIGGILDQKRSNLVSLVKDDQEIHLEFMSADGHKAEEVYTSAMIYDFWVRMYKRRTRPNP